MEGVLKDLRQPAREWMARNRSTQRELARFIGITPAALSQWLKGDTKQLSAPAYTSLSKLLTIEDHAPRAINHIRVMQDGDYVLIPRVTVDLSAGHGLSPIQIEMRDPLAFLSDWLLKSRISHADVACMSVSGESMEPRICDGDTVLVDFKDNHIRDGKPYAIRYGDSLKIKRLSSRYDGAVILSSDNPRFPQEVISGDDLQHFEVIGRIVWVGGLVT